MPDTEHFDAVVVGSGFGGAVSAYRLAEAGLSVCLLERGKRYPPDSFARTPKQMAANFWDPSKGMHGLFDLWAFRKIDAIVASGLGGGSLIYANVLLRKDPSWFVKDENEYWPVTREDLDPHYCEVEKMLLPQTYPYEASTPKTQAFMEAASEAGHHPWLPPLAVTFANPHAPPIPGEPIVGDDGKPWPNLHDRTRYTCRLCGECDIGCNYGSKNTLDYNYLSAFERKENATIRDRAEVKSFWPEGKGYVVQYVDHSNAVEGCPPGKSSKVDTKRLLADRLVLAAGTFGTTYLLLKNHRHFPGISKTRLGTHFSGNGDTLGIVSGGRVYEPSFGTVITATSREPDAVDDPGGDGGPGYYIQEGGYPAIVSWLLETLSGGTARRALRLARQRVWARLTRDPRTRIGADFAALFGDGRASAAFLPLLGMGRDTPDGLMKLDGRKKYLAVKWDAHTSKPYFDRVNGKMKEMATNLDARLRMNPLWHLGHMVVTVHPLGGCPMGRNEREGVVDSHGQVFNYPGLFVADGSVMPGPVGPNPSLTIAALADRFADVMTEPVAP
jgi:cholesterol oxidase